MLVKQISVFLENKSGRLAEVTKVFGLNDININALSIADTTDFGVLRLIVNNPDKAEAILKENGFAVGNTDVMAIAVDDKPGGLSAALDILEAETISIEYMYAFVGKKTNRALVILKVDDSVRAIESLKKNNIRVLSSTEAYEL
jgi:hypothetical protein